MTTGGRAEAVWCPMCFSQPGSGHSSLISPALVSLPLSFALSGAAWQIEAKHKHPSASQDVASLPLPFISHCSYVPSGTGVLPRSEFPDILPTQVGRGMADLKA